jgi:hypothetical protein
MKINPIRLAALLALFSCSGIHTAQAENTAAVNEVLKLKNAGVADDTIVSYIQSRNINYDLSADSILALREKGLAPAIMNAMLASGNPGAASPTPPTSVWSQPQPVVPQSPPPAAMPQPPQAAQPAPYPATMAPPQPQPPYTQPPPVYNVVQTPQAVPPAANPNAAYFYQELSPYGHWMLAEDGQWCWQPAVVATAPDWRPYWDKGHWIWTDQGWYWSSDYPWGWAVFHYGRWQLHPHHGWVWYPDHVWGPSWVVWRTGGQYCGWAPLPPGAAYDTAHGYLTFHGNQVSAGFDFGLSYAHFSFCLSTQMGHPIPAHGWNEAEAHAAFAHTTVINNYTVQRTVVGGETRVQVINHGIEPAKLNAAGGRRIEPLHVEDLRTPAPGRAHEHMDAQSKTLQVYRPKFSDHTSARAEQRASDHGHGDN